MFVPCGRILLEIPAPNFSVPPNGVRTPYSAAPRGKRFVVIV
jgi:hypothetical protein